MRRPLTVLFAALAVFSCAEESSPQTCQGKVDFIVTVSSLTGVLSPHTQIEVTFGGGNTETYSPGSVSDHEVLFCETELVPASHSGEPSAAGAPSAGASDDGAGGATATAGGSAGTSKTIHRIVCEVWSGGPAKISVRGSGLFTSRDLEPETETCSLSEQIVLGAPDPKP